MPVRPLPPTIDLTDRTSPTHETRDADAWAGRTADAVVQLEGRAEVNGHTGGPGLELFVPVRGEPLGQLAEAVRTCRALARSRSWLVVIVCGADDPATLACLSMLLRADEPAAPGGHGSVGPDAGSGRPATGAVELRVVPTCAPKALAMNEVVRQSRASWVGFFDIDVSISATDLAAALSEADRDGLDYVEFVEVSTGDGDMTRMLNIQSLLFQMANSYLAARLGSRYFSSSGLLLRRAFLDRVGPWPEDGCEEGYRWSLTAAGHRQRGRLSPAPVTGRSAATLHEALRQRRRWYRGQLLAAVDCLVTRLPVRGRILGLLGGASLLAQAVWGVSLALSPVSTGARYTFVLLTLLEGARLVAAIPTVGASLRQRYRDVGMFLAFELVEGMLVVSAMLPASRVSGWQPTVRREPA